MQKWLELGRAGKRDTPVSETNPRVSRKRIEIPENNVPDNCIGFRAGVCSLLRINVVKVRSDCSRENLYSSGEDGVSLPSSIARRGAARRGGYTSAPGQKSVTEISGFSAAGSPNCLRCYAFNLGNKETAGARWMNVTRSFVRPAPRFAASGLRRKWEKERKRRRRRKGG